MDRENLSKYLCILGYDNIPSFLWKYLDCPSLKRLQKVGYFCGMDYASKDIYDFSEKITRFDHSLTVALLTWKLTNDMKATLAGLFHDVSTPCFSHVIDYMNNDHENQESTEEKTEEIIKNDKDLIKYLEEDNVLVDEIIDFKRYSIVDIDRPMLCADRLDGVILTGMFWTKSINIDDVYNILSNIIVINNENNNLEIGFRNREIAQFVMETSELIDLYCHSKEDNYMMELLAKITRIAIDREIISYDDLYVLDEEEIMYRLENSLDIEIINYLDLFKNITRDMVPNIDMPKIKIRNLNPLVKNKRLK